MFNPKSLAGASTSKNETSKNSHNNSKAQLSINRGKSTQIEDSSTNNTNLVQ